MSFCSDPTIHRPPRHLSGTPPSILRLTPPNLPIQSGRGVWLRSGGRHGGSVRGFGGKGSRRALPSSLGVGFLFWRKDSSKVQIFFSAPVWKGDPVTMVASLPPSAHLALAI